MDDLIAWLRARLDDDERYARAAAEEAPGDWDDTWPNMHSATKVDGRYPRIAVTESPVLGIHIARHDPARVLAEVDAKRRILDWAISFMEGDYAPWNETCIKLLALPYADRDGYRTEWRP